MENCTGLVERHDGRFELLSLYGETEVISLPRPVTDGDRSVTEGSDALPGIPALPVGHTYEQVQNIA